MNVEAQKRALSDSWEAASSVLAKEWYDEGKLDDVEAAPVRSDQRRVEYSAEMAEIGFPSQGQGLNHGSTALTQTALICKGPVQPQTAPT